MPIDLTIAPEAELDIAEAYLWYEARRPGLGEEFLSSVDACIEGIRRSPEVYPVIYDAYRRSLVRRFPHAVFFDHPGKTIRIYAVLHTSRDPAKWRQRITY